MLISILVVKLIAAKDLRKNNHIDHTRVECIFDLLSRLRVYLVNQQIMQKMLFTEI